MNPYVLRTGFYRSAETKGIAEAKARLQESALFIDDNPKRTVHQIGLRCQTLQCGLEKHGKGLGLVVIDYVQLMQGYLSSHRKEIVDISQKLKFLAQDLNASIVVLSQLSRRVAQRQDNRPRLFDLSESRPLVRDASVVALIHREDYYKPNDVELENRVEILLAKNLHGETGPVSLRLDWDASIFQNAHAS